MKIKLKPQHVDDRGEIVDLLVKESIDAITRITFEKNAVRANHYHKKTTQWTLVTKGSLKYFSRHVEAGQSDTEEYELEAGDFVVARPNQIHAFKSNESSEILVFTKGPRAGFDYEKDTFRLDEPLVR